MENGNVREEAKENANENNHRAKEQNVKFLLFNTIKLCIVYARSLKKNGTIETKTLTVQKQSCGFIVDAIKMSSRVTIFKRL